MRGAHAGHGRLFLCGGLWTGGWCGKILALEAAEGGRLRAWRLPRGRNSVQKDIFRELSSMEETWSIIC